MSTRQRGRWHIGDVLLPDGAEFLLKDGVPVDVSKPIHAFVTHPGRVLEFCHTSFGIPLATRALTDAIKAIGGFDVQSIPITISAQTGMFVLHTLRVLRCIDEPRSIFQKFTADDPVRPDLAGQYRSIAKLVLDRSAIPTDAHFFRIKDWEVALIVSEAVKGAMERVGCFGAEFTEIELA